MSHLKYGLDHLGSRRMTPGSARVFAQIPLALLLSSPAFYAQAELYFNPRFLADDPAAVADLSGFEKGQELPPGTYRADIYLNDGYMATRDITFNVDEKGHGLAPCLTRGQLASMGVNTAAIAGIDVLAADAFSRFEEEGIFNRETGQSFLDNILSRGGSEEPMVLFKRFRGREPQLDAMLEHYGIKS